MKNNSSLKIAIASALATAVSIAAVSNTAMASNHSDQQIYRDSNFGQVAQQLRQNLRRSGYYVMDIKADGNRAIRVYAKKNNKPYELKYTYPALKLISSEQKEWSNLWQNKTNHNNNNHYNQRHKNDDIEDKIKNESRYSAVRQRAIRKVTSMGYRVEDIELDEKNNRGVFEIEAEKGSQDYEISLSYPNLNVIKVEKD